MELIPLNKHIIIKRTAKEEKSAGGIVMPASEVEQPTMGTIIAIDPDTELSLAVGMIILFGKYAGKEFKVAGQDYLIIKDDEVIAMVDMSDG